MKPFEVVPDYAGFVDMLDETRPYESICAVVRSAPELWTMEDATYTHGPIARLGGIAVHYRRALEYSILAPLTAWETLAYLEEPDDRSGETIKDLLLKLGDHGTQTRGAVVSACLRILQGKHPSPINFPMAAIDRYMALNAVHEDLGVIVMHWLTYLARLECGKLDEEPVETTEIAEYLEIFE